MAAINPFAKKKTKKFQISIKNWPLSLHKSIAYALPIKLLFQSTSIYATEVTICKQPLVLYWKILNAAQRTFLIL